MHFFYTAYVPLEDSYVLGKGVMYICCVMLDGCTPAMTSHYIYRQHLCLALLYFPIYTLLIWLV